MNKNFKILYLILIGLGLFSGESKGMHLKRFTGLKKTSTEGTKTITTIAIDENKLPALYNAVAALKELWEAFSVKDDKRVELAIKNLEQQISTIKESDLTNDYNSIVALTELGADAFYKKHRELAVSINSMNRALYKILAPLPIKDEYKTVLAEIPVEI